MVQKVMFPDRPAGLHNICWIFPLVLLIIALGTYGPIINFSITRSHVIMFQSVEWPQWQ